MIQGFRGMIAPGQGSSARAVSSNLLVPWLWRSCLPPAPSFSSITLLEGTPGMEQLSSGLHPFCAHSLLLGTTECDFVCQLRPKGGRHTWPLNIGSLADMIFLGGWAGVWAAVSSEPFLHDGAWCQEASFRLGGSAPLAGCVLQTLNGCQLPFAFHQPVAINTVTFPTYCIYVSENVCVAYVM